VSELPEKNKNEPSGDGLDRYTATTIPVHIDISAQQTVLSFAEAEEILRQATAIALGPCDCRKSNRKCDAPVNTCLSLNTASEAAVTSSEFHFISVDEALATLAASHEAGLVHLAFRQNGSAITEFCSCCSCCCWFLTRLKVSDDPEALTASPVIATMDAAACIGCGTCVDRCQFYAWTQDRLFETPTFTSERCYGCGVCVSGCQAGALSLVPRNAE